VIFVEPGTVVPLNIAAAAGEHLLSVPPGFPLAAQRAVSGHRKVDASWRFAGGATSVITPLDGRPIELRSLGRPRAWPVGVALDRNSYLQSAALGLDPGASADPARSQAPQRVRCSFLGIVPPRVDGALLFYMMGWGVGGLSLFTQYGSDRLECQIGRGDRIEGGFASSAKRSPGTEQLLEVEWRDLPDKPGGTISFFIDGKPAGGPFPTRMKPRIAPETSFSINAALGNNRQAIDGLVVREARLSVDRPIVDHVLTPVGTGPIDGATLPSLVIDARSITVPEAVRTLAWRHPDGSVVTLDVVIGPLEVPPGQAYRAVLEDWSSGQRVDHPNHLVMTRISAQNCRFEDGWLGEVQPAWIECLPQGPVPNIAGIDYRCEAIRSGDYVQFQFGYDWDAATMPANPFGDPSGKHSYMVPHKWRIEDQSGSVLAIIDTPDGGPLNGADKPFLYAGETDGRGCAKISRRDRWYPHGTVRSGVIWRNSDPPDHQQAGVRRSVPLFDLSVPFGCHLDYSVNGFDLRIFAGGAGNEGQANGFGNIRVIPWEQSDYATMVGRAGRTHDPYGALLYSPNSMAANAALWLKYTPFNIQGRSPVTGSGGMRDDRQIIAEPVAFYIDRPDGVRPHDRTPWRAIALDYLTGYVSDPVHAFEKGRNRPVFKQDAQRAVAARNHYYGPGNLALPEQQCWYQQGGRVAGWVRGSSPLRVTVPYAGDSSGTPYFGTFQIDKLHGHQFPGWGSLLFRTPEFAFLGHRFWDQNRLASNDIIGDPWLDLWSSREGGWAFLHAALAWKTASATSDRLYSRAEVMDFVLFDFELFHDRHFASSPGFLNPPANLLSGGRPDMRLATYAAARCFGIVAKSEIRIYQHEFSIGYWLSALAAGEKLGFNEALRQGSTKVRAVIDWLIAMHRRRVIGRLTEAPCLPPLDGSNYLVGLWSAEHITAAAGEVARLPQTYAALEGVWGKTARWDQYVDDRGEVSRDGQAMDQLIAGPSQLRYLLGQSGDDLLAAQSIANQWREEKKALELAKGAAAGSGWFTCLQATNNPARAVQA